MVVQIIVGLVLAVSVASVAITIFECVCWLLDRFFPPSPIDAVYRQLDDATQQVDDVLHEARVRMLDAVQTKRQPWMDIL